MRIVRGLQKCRESCCGCAAMKHLVGVLTLFRGPYWHRCQINRHHFYYLSLVHHPVLLLLLLPPQRPRRSQVRPPSHVLFCLTHHARPDRREVTPVRPRSLQFSLRSPRGSDQPLIRPPMADVKRSVSVIEARNTPKNDASGASSELTDPVPTFSKAPQTLTPFSALTRSRSLFSGRVPDTNSPMSSSLQAEPSTPTPAPRHLSDKSRGKRKAEDNLDLTPPEQKKEGQHTTFLLPTEARSESHIYPCLTALSALS
jgi:hypothetical protein